MGGLLYPVADLLVRQSDAAPGTNAAPTFGFYRFDPERPKKDQLVEKCDAVLAAFPSLGGDDGVRRLIGRCRRCRDATQDDVRCATLRA